MKKLVKVILAIMVSVILVSSITACDEVKNGSKIQKVKITLELIGADDLVILDSNGNETNEFTVTAELYLNYAEKTTKHFLSLVDDEFYNDTVVSHIGDSWCEFGGYKGSSEALVKADENVDYIEGEFEKNGLVGNNLRSNAGVLIMKHDYASTSEVSKYNSAKSTVIMTMFSASKFDYREYCIFGKILSDDSDSDADSSSAFINSSMSSLAKLQQLYDLAVKNETTTLYFNEKESEYYVKHYDDENKVHYYTGNVIDESKEILDEAQTEFVERLNDDKEKNDFLVVPYATIKIKEIVRV